MGVAIARLGGVWFGTFPGTAGVLAHASIGINGIEEIYSGLVYPYLPLDLTQ